MEAQAVQTASLVPCIASLPVGWSLGEVYANSGRSAFTVDHDRAGHAALEVTLTGKCDIRGTIELAPDVDGARRLGSRAAPGDTLDETWYEVFSGGCTTTRLHSRSSRAEVNAEVSRQGSTIVRYVTRDALAGALTARSHGRLHLDPR
jgi:hypothetical protein